MTLRFVDLDADTPIIEAAHDDAEELLRYSRDLGAVATMPLRQEVVLRYGDVFSGGERRMRIVGGMWRGRRLFEPSGSDVTRPTTDRVREAMASMVDSALPEGIEGARVLDAFGGSGALGIEMLSRGGGVGHLF